MTGSNGLIFKNKEKICLFLLVCGMNLYAYFLQLIKFLNFIINSS